MAKKRKRAYVMLGPDMDGKTIKKWVQGYTKKQLEDEKNRVRLEFQQEMALERERREQLLVEKTPEVPENTENIATGDSPEPDHMPMVQTLSEYAHSWYTVFKEPNVREQTQHMYLNILDKHIGRSSVGQMPINRITRSDLQMFISSYAGKSTSLIDKIMVVLRQVFSSAMEDGFIVRNPTSKLSPPKGTKGERLPIELDAVTRITDALRGEKESLFVFLLLYAGLRRSEALGLRWGDIQPDGIHIERAATFRGNTTIVGETKSKAAHRVIPVLPPLEEALNLFERGADSDYVLDGDAVWTQGKFNRRWEKTVRMAPDLKGVTPHQLRHTFLRMLRRSGVDPATQQYLMGHSEYEETATDYTHIDSDDRREAKALFERKLLPDLLPEKQPINHCPV